MAAMSSTDSRPTPQLSDGQITKGTSPQILELSSSSASSSSSTMTLAPDEQPTTVLPKSTASSTVPPPLPYSLHTRKRGIAISFTLILTSACFAPVLIYFLMTRFSTISLSIICTIITVVPILQFFDFFLRAWQLARPSDISRPLHGSPRWAFDFYHWCYTIGVIVITACLSSGSASGNIVLIALPLPYLLTFVGTTMVMAQILVLCGARTPIRLSSLRRGEKVRPGVFIIVEDIVAVNGGGGKEFRAAWGERFEASATMRRLLSQLSWFWSVPALSLGIVLIVLLAKIDAEIAYGLAWTLPWAWVAVWSMITIRWVKRALVEEREEFAMLNV